ncbi:uncharacterized protein LOC118740942 [Rhagoletis pomonella]|uniref:uncharacterized protein LOC118740942 n=1 Tax=Rhagoletis pomonella TaxID=28610 RepID=UPI00177EB45D|nr:uncharacterized protein LOC118740942 [Rhagoletis pomonella]
MESAIFYDCRKLLENFVRSGDSSFASFCKEWKTLQFQHIYFAQISYIEIMQTTSAIMYYAKSVLRKSEKADKSNHSKSKKLAADGNHQNTTAKHFDEERLRRRICCIYLLYAIYFKQPTERFIKIETNLETWRAIKNFIDSLPETADMDAPRYVFWRLLQEKAFRFTALNYCVALDDLVDYDKLDDKKNVAFCCKNSGKELGQQLQDIPATQRILPALCVLEDGYNEMKEMLVKSNTSGMHKQSLPSTSIFKSIEESFQTMHTIINDEERVLRKNRSVQEENTRRNLKRKGFTHAHKKIEDDDGAANEEKSNKYKNLRRMSARTVFTDELPDDLLEDLEELESCESLNDLTIDLSEHDDADGSTSDVTTVHLTESQEEYKYRSDNMPEVHQEEGIEQQIDELLEAELSEDIKMIPKEN